MIPYPRQLCLALTLSLWFGLALSAAATDKLERGFANPPPESRPEVLWDWMGGLISRDGITKDLEALKAQGMGGVMIMQMPDQCPYPKQWSFRDYPGKVTCLSDEYFATMNFAISEADRLGLNFGVFACPGWSHFGGPWTKPAQGLKKLAASRTFVSGATNVNLLLPKPPVFPTSGGGNGIPEWSADRARLPQAQENFYRDETVLATPWLGPGKIVATNQIINLTGRMDAQGRLNWDAPRGDWVVWRLALVSENGVNHPAPIDAIGLECDRMDVAAVGPVFDGYVGRIAREAKAKGYRAFKSFETDSYEGGYQDYGYDYREEFQRRRGYDCVPWLPAWLERNVVIGSAELSERFRHDMVRTMTELWSERFHATLRKLADQHGLQWMTEAYGMVNLNWREIVGRSAHAGWEFWVGQEWGSEQDPSTTALTGQRVVWAESFTAEPYRSAWRIDPWTMKLDGDRAFSRGINHFIMHGFVHQPFGDQFQPGLTMGYWGTQLSRHATWWNYSRAWHEYLARCQFLLQAGWPNRDVLVFPPPDYRQGRRVEDGYRRVTLTEDVLLEKLSVRQSKLVVPCGTQFAALALNPDLPVRPEALKKILQLVKNGAALIGNPPPGYSASLQDYPQCDVEVAKLIGEIWNGADTNAPVERKLGRGRVLSGMTQVEALAKLIGPPDLVCTDLKAPGKSPAVRSISLRDGKTEYWFVCNQSDEDLEIEASFRISGRQPEWWNPLDGSRRTLTQFRFENGRALIPLRLAPRGSGFVMFRNSAKRPQAAPLTLNKNFPAATSMQAIDGPWEVAFDPRWGGPGQVTFTGLPDWSTRPENGIRYYSGTAVYRTSFDTSRTMNRDSQRFLDLGVVKNLARVRLNGHDLGIVWCAPWRVAIPAELLKQTGNQLEIEVVNTWVNRMIGDEFEPEDCELEPGNATGDRKGGYAIEIRGRGLKDLPDWFVEGRPRPSSGRYSFTSWRYYDKDAPLQPSGLLGPVRLLQNTPTGRNL